MKKGGTDSMMEFLIFWGILFLIAVVAEIASMQLSTV